MRFPSILLSTGLLPLLLSSPRAEIALNYFFESGSSQAVAVQGNVVLGGLGTYLLAIDATNPSDMVRMSSEYVSGGITGIDWVGSRACVAHGFGLVVFDTSNPLDPVKLGEDLSASASDVAIVGNIAYVTRSTTGFRSVDISDPSHPTVIGTGSAQGWPRGIRVVGSYAYIAGFMGGLTIMDISNPASPVQVGFRAVWGNGWDLDVVGTRAYVPGSTGLAIIDVSNPTAPLEIGRYEGGLNFGRCVAVAGNYAYLCDQSYEFQVIDVSVPSNPVLVAQYDTGGALAIARQNNRLLTADAGSGFTVRDIATPTAPIVEGRVRRLQRGRAIAFQNDMLYVGDDANGKTIDLVTYTDPTIIGSGDSYGIFSALHASGTRLYVGRSDPIFDGELGGLSIFDITDPSSPNELSYKYGFDSVYDIESDGTYAYLLGYYQGYKLRIYDVTNEAMPIGLTTVNLPSVSENFELDNNLLLVTSQTNDLRIYDVTNPATPSLKSTFTGTEDARDVSVIGTLAFVADRVAGLVVVDFSTPEQPVEVSRLTSIGTPEYVMAKNPYVVLCGSDPSLRIIDVSDPTTPVVVDSYQTGGSYEIAVQGSRIATFIRPEGSVALLDAPILNVVSAAESTPLPRFSIEAYPNPFNPSTTVTIANSRRGFVELDVFDAAGRHVRTLFRGQLLAGTTRIAWDGRNGAGNNCASGVYFCRLVGVGEMITRKLVLLK